MSESTSHSNESRSPLEKRPFLAVFGHVETAPAAEGGTGWRRLRCHSKGHIQEMFLSKFERIGCRGDDTGG